MDQAYELLVNGFNEYTNEKNIDLELKLTYFTDSSETVGYNDYSKTLSILGRKNNKFDIFGFDIQYLNIFSPYLLELDKHLPKNFTDLYSSDINKKLTYHDGHIRGLVIIIYII